jgi:hypothetical protein
VVKVGRTHLQDATPVTLGQEFGGYDAQLGMPHSVAARPARRACAGDRRHGGGHRPEHASRVRRTRGRALAQRWPAARASPTTCSPPWPATKRWWPCTAALRMLAIALTKIGNDIRLMGSGPRAGSANCVCRERTRQFDHARQGQPDPGRGADHGLRPGDGPRRGHRLRGQPGAVRTQRLQAADRAGLLDSLRLLADAMYSFSEHCVRRTSAAGRTPARAQALLQVVADAGDRAGPAHRLRPRLLLSVSQVATYDGTRLTSRHVLIDRPSAHFPDRIEIELHVDAVNLTRSAQFSMLLYRNGRSVWRQGRDASGEIDVAVVEIDRAALPASAVFHAFSSAHLQTSLSDIEVGAALLIVGFPLGFHDTLHHLPVVRQAVIASSFGLRFQGQGYFLTDARTHRGTSGAPVVMRAAAPDLSGSELPWKGQAGRGQAVDRQRARDPIWPSIRPPCTSKRGATGGRHRGCKPSAMRADGRQRARQQAQRGQVLRQPLGRRYSSAWPPARPAAACSCAARASSETCGCGPPRLRAADDQPGLRAAQQLVAAEGDDVAAGGDLLLRQRLARQAVGALRSTSAPLPRSVASGRPAGMGDGRQLRFVHGGGEALHGVVAGVHLHQQRRCAR